ncbi:MAG: hypothetical protein VX185_11665 [Pseudomonadota bacterium]|nr:hypothetical protein [Pseudomonadota bacterium]
MSILEKGHLLVALFLFAQQSWQTRLLAREQNRPDSGEDNPNDKGVTGQR